MDAKLICQTVEFALRSEELVAKEIYLEKIIEILRLTKL
jgi:hypothetical protein